MLAYEGHPLELTCPQCLLAGTAWFSPDETSHLRIDEIPPGFALRDQALEATGPQFTCLSCNIEATRL